MPLFDYRRRQCADNLELEHSANHGHYRIHTEPSCNEEIFNLFKDKRKYEQFCVR